MIIRLVIMSGTVVNYMTVVSDSLKCGLEDEVIAATLADRAGIMPDELQLMSAILPRLEAAWSLATSIDGVQAQATQNLRAGVKMVRATLSDLRQTMRNNLPRHDPLYIAFGLSERQPASQHRLLIYAVRAFSNGVELPVEQREVLTKRTWDTARFEAALAQARATQVLNYEQEAAKAQAKATTAALYALVDELDAPFRPYAKEARRVLAHLPGALDKMNLAKGVPQKPVLAVYKPRRRKAAPATPEIEPAGEGAG